MSCGRRIKDAALIRQRWSPPAFTAKNTKASRGDQRSLLKASTTSCPFDQWVLDCGTFSIGLQQKKFFLVAVDYFSKWVEAEALTRITEEAVIKFLWKRSSADTANGQAEVTNREILCGLKTKLDHEGGSWVEELPCVLWSYRTTPRESTGITPFHLVYGGEAVVPIEVGVQSNRRRLYDEDNGECRRMELAFVTDDRDRAVARLTTYRQECAPPTTGG
ncbi:uncharacterized protein LOC141829108 [Curcuma longa]|uniref:uncharacterized protein LOC141829108 n=1 Tax=Curcuma longa TaxID=136217 RepID=UPI003D9F41EB